jgi:glycosyltransferase involved in cell wall biosynthesis
MADVDRTDGNDAARLRSIRIGHVVPSFYPASSYGGPITSLYDLCRAQLAAGRLVRVLTSDAAGEGGGSKRLVGLSGRLACDFGVPTFYGRVAFLEDVSPELLTRLPAFVGWADVVHVTGLFSATSLAGVLAATCLPGRRRPCVLSPRGSLLPWALRKNGPRKRLFLRAAAPLLRRVDGWHATSEEEAAAIRALCAQGVVGQNAAVAVVPNGVGVSSDADIPPKKRSREAALVAPRIVVLGRVHPVKNLELAIAALAELKKRAPGAVLLIVGPERPPSGNGDDYGVRLRAQAAELGVSSSVQFVGLKVGEEKQRLLREADALWLTSHMESFGNVVLEALAAGTPVVAAQTTPWQLLEELHGGRWVPPTATAFCEATLSILAEPNDATEQAAAAGRCLEIVKQRFAWPRVERAMCDLYDEALRRWSAIL